MSKNITINNGGRYDDQSYTDERHYHYGEASEKKTENDDEKVMEGKLNQRQLVILMSELLGVSSLQKEYLPGGQDALAYIVSLVSGESQKALRQKIRDLADEQQKGEYTTPRGPLGSLGIFCV